MISRRLVVPMVLLVGTLAAACGDEELLPVADAGASSSSGGSSSSSGAPSSGDAGIGADAGTADSSVQDASVSDGATEAGALSNDPFDAAACAGPSLGFAEAMAQLGEQPFVTLASYTLMARERTCDGDGVCGAWQEPYVAAAKHYGGNTTGGFPLRGELRLQTRDEQIEVVAMDASIFTPDYDSLHFLSPTQAGPLGFPPDTAYRYTAEDQSFIPPSPVNDAWLATFELSVGVSCAQVRSLETSAEGPVSKQYALLARY